MLSVKIRISAFDEIRRFSIDASITLEQLTAKLIQHGAIISSEHFLVYTDDEGDEVRLDTHIFHIFLVFATFGG